MELVTAGADSAYVVLQSSKAEIENLIRENLAGENLSPGDLDRVKVPGAGGTSWEVPGEDPTRTLTGVILRRDTRRAYWSTSFEERGADDEGRPDCYSDDGMQGHGDPGVECAVCPYNEFESAENGIGKACKETRQLFLLPADSLIPIVVTVPPGSLANAKAYFLRLLRKRIGVQDVETVLTLSKNKSKQGIEFAKVEFAQGRALDPTAAQRLKEFSALLAPNMDRAARVEPSEVGAGA